MNNSIHNKLSAYISISKQYAGSFNSLNIGENLIKLLNKKFNNLYMFRFKGSNSEYNSADFYLRGKDAHFVYLPVNNTYVGKGAYEEICYSLDNGIPVFRVEDNLDISLIVGVNKNNPTDWNYYAQPVYKDGTFCSDSSRLHFITETISKFRNPPKFIPHYEQTSDLLLTKKEIDQWLLISSQI